MNLPEKLQNIVDKCNRAEKCSNAERNQRFAKELAVFESTKEKTNNISKLYEALKSVKRKKNTKSCAYYSHVTCTHFRLISRA